jgi:hypothetical protein
VGARSGFGFLIGEWAPELRDPAWSFDINSAHRLEIKQQLIGRGGSGIAASGSLPCREDDPVATVTTSRLRADRERAGGIRRAHQDGSAKMDEADPRCQYQAGMTDAS